MFTTKTISGPGGKGGGEPFSLLVALGRRSDTQHNKGVRLPIAIRLNKWRMFLFQSFASAGGRQSFASAQRLQRIDSTEQAVREREERGKSGTNSCLQRVQNLFTA